MGLQSRVMDSNLLYLLIGIGIIAALALLYPLFYRTRKKGGTDELNWVNKSNYDISAPQGDLEEIDKASPTEARAIAEQMTHQPNAIPVNDEEFAALQDKMGEHKNTDEVKRELRNPS